jgi:hypothetical protein
MGTPVTRRSFLKGIAALVAGGMLPVSGVRAAWEKLPPEPEGVTVWGDRTVVRPGYNFTDDFELELMQAMSEEIAKDMDRAFVEELLAAAEQTGWSRQVFPVEGSV